MINIFNSIHMLKSYCLMKEFLHKHVLQYETLVKHMDTVLSISTNSLGAWDENIHDWGCESFTFQPSSVPWWFSNAVSMARGESSWVRLFTFWCGTKTLRRGGFLVEIMWNHMKLRNHIEIQQSLMFMAFEFCDVGELNQVVNMVT